MRPWSTGTGVGGGHGRDPTLRRQDDKVQLAARSRSLLLTESDLDQMPTVGSLVVPFPLRLLSSNSTLGSCHSRVSDVQNALELSDLLELDVSGASSLRRRRWRRLGADGACACMTSE